MSINKKSLYYFFFIKIILLTTLYIFLVKFYLIKDYNLIFEKHLFPWDSFETLKLVNNFELNYKKYSVNPPFNERILYPYLIFICSFFLKLDIIQATLVINLVAFLISTYLLILLFEEFKISKITQLFIFLIFLISWNGPLRTSIFYPGGSFGFDTMMISIMTYFWFKYIKKKNYFLLILLHFIIFIFTLQRGIVILSFPIFFFIVNFLFKKFKNIKYNIVNDFSVYLIINSLIAIIIIKIFTLYPTSITNSSGSYTSYSAFYNILKFGAFRMHPLEFLYTYYLSFGPMFLISITFIFLYVLKNFKKINIKYIKKININDGIVFYVVIFLHSIALSTFGGDDSDRFIQWFYLWYLLFAAFCLDFFYKYFSKYFLIFFLVLGLLWSRAFLPSQPPFIFSPKFIMTQYANTNYDEKYFRGFEFIKKFKNQLYKEEIIIGEPYNINKNSEKQYVFINKKFANPELYYFNWTHAYKGEINNIPFPIGYLHNQRDAMVDHPTWGKSWVRYTYVFQWIIINLIIIIFFYKKTLKIYKYKDE